MNTAMESGNNIQVQDNTAREGLYQIDLVDLFFRLIDKARYIVICAVIGAVAAGLYTEYRITPMYKATSKLYVLNAQDSAINIADLQIGTYLAYDYMEVFYNWQLHDAVIKELGLPYSYGRLAGMLTVENPENTRILYITITSPDPKECKLLADTYAIKAKEFIAETMSTEMPNIFEEALTPSAPFSPSKVRNITLGFLLGLIASCGWITVTYVLDDKIRTAEDVERYLGMATLGLLPLQEDKNSGKKKSKKGKKRQVTSA